MDVKIGPMTGRLIGDPHLGRKFEVGVPMNRRGEREKRVMEDFRSRLTGTKGVDFTICMGDIFDKFIVEPEVVLGADDAYANADSIPHYCIRGNHDGSRYAERRSSFDVLTRLADVHRRVIMVRERPLFVDAKHATVLLVPWHPFLTAKEMAKVALDEWKENGSPKIDAIFGHWDIEDFSEMGGNADNVIPVGILRQMSKTIYTGHVHTPGRKAIADLEIIVTGSMQPYTHGEDPNHDVYVTVTLAELRQMVPGTLRDKCVRVALEDGEELPADIDCLQLTRFSRKAKADEKAEEVRIEEFDMDRLLSESLTEGKVPEAAQQKIKAKFKEMSP